MTTNELLDPCPLCPRCGARTVRLYRPGSVLPYCGTCRIGFAFAEEPWPPPILVRKVLPDWIPLENPPEPEFRPHRPRPRRPHWAVDLSYREWKRQERERSEESREKQRKYWTRRREYWAQRIRVRCWTLEGFADAAPPSFAQSGVWPPQFHVPALAFATVAEMSEITEPEFDRYEGRWTET